MRYWTSIVRFVPDPARGEFINVGAIAGTDETDDWQIRTVANWTRAKRLDEDGKLGALMTFVSDFTDRAEFGTLGFGQPASPLSLDRLRQLSDEMRNVVQVSTPTPVLASSAEAALELVFSEFVVDPAFRSFPFKKKTAAMSAIREAYSALDIHPLRNAQVRVGPYQTDFDFAVANGRAVQLVRCWSFELPDQDDLAEQVKAWAWSVRALRRGAGDVTPYLIGDSRQLSVDPSVDVEAVFIPPTDRQKSKFAFDVALDAFGDMETSIRVVDAKGAGETAKRASLLLHA